MSNEITEMLERLAHIGYNAAMDGNLAALPWGQVNKPPYITFVKTILENIPVAEERKPSDRQVGGTHYKDLAVQPWDAMQAWMSEDEFRGFLRGNVVKYIARCEDKGGVEDLKKAQHYLEKLIERYDARTAAVD